jgi:hypothetical protein
MADIMERWASVGKAELGDVKIDKQKAREQSLRYGSGCFRFILGKTVTEDEFKARKEKVFGGQSSQ